MCKKCVHNAIVGYLSGLILQKFRAMLPGNIFLTCYLAMILENLKCENLGALFRPSLVSNPLPPSLNEPLIPNLRHFEKIMYELFAFAMDPILVGWLEKVGSTKYQCSLFSGYSS